MSDPNNYFNRMRRGELPPPAVFGLLGGVIREVDPHAGTLRADYVAAPAFANPGGTVQGGMLCAMLDDLCASLVDATLSADEVVGTLNLNTSFLRPAHMGLLQGQSEIARRGRDICHVTATLAQEGKVVAMASATCKVMQASSHSKPTGAS